MHEGQLSSKYIIKKIEEIVNGKIRPGSLVFAFSFSPIENPFRRPENNHNTAASSTIFIDSNNLKLLLINFKDSIYEIGHSILTI